MADSVVALINSKSILYFSSLNALAVGTARAPFHTLGQIEPFEHLLELQVLCMKLFRQKPLEPLVFCIKGSHFVEGNRISGSLGLHALLSARSRGTVVDLASGSTLNALSSSTC